MVSIKPRLPLRALPRRPSTLKSEDEVLKERSHMVLALEFPHLTQLLAGDGLS